jgi:hypothetical protein
MKITMILEQNEFLGAGLVKSSTKDLQAIILRVSSFKFFQGSQI